MINIQSMPVITLEEGSYPLQSKGTNQAGKRVSIVVSKYISTPQLDRTNQNLST